MVCVNIRNPDKLSARTLLRMDYLDFVVCMTSCILHGLFGLLYADVSNMLYLDYLDRFIYGIYWDECRVYISIDYISLSEVLFCVSALLHGKLEEIGWIPV